MLTAYYKVKLTINSCRSKEQYKSSVKMVRLFFLMYKNVGQKYYEEINKTLQSKQDEFVWF